MPSEQRAPDRPPGHRRGGQGGERRLQGVELHAGGGSQPGRGGGCNSASEKKSRTSWDEGKQQARVGDTLVDTAPARQSGGCEPSNILRERCVTPWSDQRAVLAQVLCQRPPAVAGQGGASGNVPMVVSTPDASADQLPTRRWGFLLYLAFANQGLRPTTVNRWGLRLRASNGSTADLKAFSIPEPRIEFSSRDEGVSSPGCAGVFHDEERALSRKIARREWPSMSTNVGSDSRDPSIEDGQIRVEVIAGEVFGRKARCQTRCRERD